MNEKTILFALVILSFIALIAYLVYRNLKDEKKFERDLDEKDMRRIHQNKDVHEKFDKFGNK